MECSNRPVINYQIATERLLVALSFIAGKVGIHPVPAINLCAHVFDRELRTTWSHESKRRRIRDIVTRARRLLQARGQAMTIVANNDGYWITGDKCVMSWYADQRRRHAVQELAAGKQIADTVAHAGQKSLFPESTSKLRH